MGSRASDLDDAAAAPLYAHQTSANPVAPRLPAGPTGSPAYRANKASLGHSSLLAVGGSHDAHSWIINWAERTSAPAQSKAETPQENK